MDKLSKLNALSLDNPRRKYRGGMFDAVGEDSNSLTAFDWGAPETQGKKDITDGRVEENNEVEFAEARGKQVEVAAVDDTPAAVNAPAGPSEPEFGQLAEDGLQFTPLLLIKKYPYAFIGEANRQKVAEGFFDQNKLFNNNSWDVYYLYRSTSGYDSNPFLLIPTDQFEDFLSTINKTLRTQLAIPSGGPNAYFNFTFINDGTPQPRFLGRSTSVAKLDDLKMNMPPNNYRLQGEPELKPDDKSLEAFKAKIEKIALAQKAKKTANKEKTKAERIVKQKLWGNEIKRVQRYIGLRETREAAADNARRVPVNPSTSEDQIVQELAHTSFNPSVVAPFKMEADVVFICIDAEAYERDVRKVTEIGISTLDTRDIVNILPGEGGVDWFKAIRSRHFRIREYMHLNNKDFVDGCADKFQFGESEVIDLRDAATVVASCFKEPFSKPGATAVDTQGEKRNIILVGHDVMADVNFLRNIGYDVYNLSNLLEQVDTASMWRYCTRDSNPRNLGSILANLNILGWFLHNAGNDAAYTLQAMLGTAIKNVVDKQRARVVKEVEKNNRIAEVVAEATANAVEREEGWSSEEGSDGGKAVKPSTELPVRGNGKPPKNKVTVLSTPWGTGDTSTGHDHWGGRSSSKIHGTHTYESWTQSSQPKDNNRGYQSNWRGSQNEQAISSYNARAAPSIDPQSYPHLGSTQTANQSKRTTKEDPKRAKPEQAWSTQPPTGPRAGVGRGNGYQNRW